MEKINFLASDPDKIRTLTGFNDGAPGGDITKDLFILVAILEMYSSAYLDADCFFSKAQEATSQATFLPRDRLLSYLKLIK